MLAQRRGGTGGMCCKEDVREEDSPITLFFPLLISKVKMHLLQKLTSIFIAVFSRYTAGGSGLAAGGVGFAT